MTRLAAQRARAIVSSWVDGWIDRTRALFWSLTLPKIEPAGRNEGWLEDRLFGAMLDTGRPLLVTLDDFLWASSMCCKWVGCDCEVKRPAPGCFIVELTDEAPSGEISAFALALAANAAPGIEVVVRMPKFGWEERRAA